MGVFEASIDALSHATLVLREGHDPYAIERIALGGVGSLPLLEYLKRNPHRQNIQLYLDGDEAGRTGAQRLKETLLQLGYTPERGYTCQIFWPPNGAKDWNEALCN